MDALTAADPTELPRATYYQVVHTLRGLLPPPITATPEGAAHRDHAAIAHVASLLPANPDEANLAAQYVAAGAHALDCLRLTREYPNDTALFVKCTAQSASMMRQARGWRTALQRAQDARRKRGADPVLRDAAAATEHTALGLLADALHQAPVPRAAELSPLPDPALPAEKPFNPVTEAERYAVLHRKRAVLIRRLGRLPDKVNVGWLRPEVVQAIVTGTTPILRALDQKTPRGGRSLLPEGAGSAWLAAADQAQSRDTETE
jgi:hypothetical protein